MKAIGIFTARYIKCTAVCQRTRPAPCKNTILFYYRTQTPASDQAFCVREVVTRRKIFAARSAPGVARNWESENHLLWQWLLELMHLATRWSKFVHGTNPEKTSCENIGARPDDHRATVRCSGVRTMLLRSWVQTSGELLHRRDFNSSEDNNCFDEYTRLWQRQHIPCRFVRPELRHLTLPSIRVA